MRSDAPETAHKPAQREENPELFYHFNPLLNQLVKKTLNTLGVAGVTVKGLSHFLLLEFSATFGLMFMSLNSLGIQKSFKPVSK